MALKNLAFGLLLIASSALGGPSDGRMMAYLDAQIEKQPDNPVHYLRRANGHAELGEWDEAFDDLTQVEQKGAVMAATLARGDFYQRLGKGELAREQFNAVLNAQPNNIQALIKRERLLVELAQPKAALTDYQSLFQIYPAAEVGHYRQAANLWVNQGQPKQALALLDKRMQATGSIPQLQRLAIDIERDRGNYAAAIKRMRHLNIAADLLTARQHTRADKSLLQRIGQLREAAIKTASGT